MNFLQTLLEALGRLWPFRIVEQWERGGWYWLGRYRGDVGPGVYPVVPWFGDVKTLSSVETPVVTPRLDVTLKDGTMLSFNVAATMKVVDFNKAFNTIDQYRESAIELLSAIVADRLSDLDSVRLEPDARRKLLSDLRGWVNQEAEKYGIKALRVRFTTFVLRPRMLRLLGDLAGSGW